MPVLEISHLELERGSRAIVNGASFEVDRGESVAIMGASGVGKSSILRAIAGLDPIVSGRIVVDGISFGSGHIPRGHIRRDLYRRVGIVFQFHYLFEHLTALQNVWLGPVHVLRQPRHEAERRARDLLDQLGITSRADAMPRELSGGEAQRVAIARALAMGPQVLLMDEPTASLDSALRDELSATLRRLTKNGCALVLASHDADFVRSCADRILVLADGQLMPLNR